MDRTRGNRLKLSLGVAGLTIVVIVAGTVPSIAGEWTIEPRLRVSETYTDNVRLAETNVEEDFVNVTSPGISIHGQGARTRLDLDYALEYFSFANQSGEDDFRNQLTATGLAELVDERLFVDAQASVSEEVVTNTEDISASEFNISGNRETTQIYNVSPYTVHRFGSWANGEARHRYSLIDVAGGESIGRSTLNETTLDVVSGTRFTNLGWALTGSYERLDRDGGIDRNTITGISEVSYQFDPILGAFAQVGYETFKDDTFNENPDGVFVEGGIRLTPGRRTELEVSFGNRYQTADLGLDFRYQVSTRTLFTITYAESVTTSQGILVSRLAGVGFAGQGRDGEFVSGDTGARFPSGDQAFGFSNAAFRQELWDSALVGRRGRNSFDLHAFHERRITGGSGEKERSLGGSLRLGRDLGRRSTLSIAGTYTFFDFSGPVRGGREDNLVTAEFGYRYRIGDSLTSSLNYTHSQRTSNQEAGTEFKENAVTLQFVMTF